MILIGGGGGLLQIGGDHLKERALIVTSSSALAGAVQARLGSDAMEVER
jgi:hypothetical protein